jgi:hypothetical protein
VEDDDVDEMEHNKIHFLCCGSELTLTTSQTLHRKIEKKNKVNKRKENEGVSVLLFYSLVIITKTNAFFQTKDFSFCHNPLHHFLTTGSFFNSTPSFLFLNSISLLLIRSN